MNPSTTLPAPVVAPVTRQDLVEALFGLHETATLASVIAAYLRHHSFVSNDEMDQLLREVRSMLTSSAYAKALNAMDTGAYDDDPVYVARGDEADRIALCCRVADVMSHTGGHAAAREIAYVCSQLSYASLSDPDGIEQHVFEILDFVDQRFGFVNDLIYPDGVLIVAIPSLVHVDYPTPAFVQPTFTGIHGTLILQAGSTATPERQVYDILAQMLMAATGTEDKMPEQLLDYLAETTAPDIRQLDEEAQLAAYENSLVLGLSHNGPFVVDSDESIGEEARQDWADYVSAVIRNLAEWLEGGRQV